MVYRCKIFIIVEKDIIILTRYSLLLLVSSYTLIIIAIRILCQSDKISNLYDAMMVLQVTLNIISVSL